MNRKRFALIFILFFFAPVCAHAETPFAERLKGRILLQVESYGRAWYVDPVSGKRFYLKDGETAYALMREKGLGITNANLEKIPAKKGQAGDKKLIERVKGRILLQVEGKGESWYVNPTDGVRYYLKDGEAAYKLMRSAALGVKNADLKKIPMNGEQVAYAGVFDSVAYAAYRNGSYETGVYADEILPLASLTKLMTALVFVDQYPNWDAYATITKEHILYPKSFVGDDATSEVDYKAGERVRLRDAFAALLIASSNQSAAVLADATGLPRSEFVALMNEKARTLGLKKTKFYDVSGLDANNVSTPKEMALLAAAAFSDTAIAETARQTSYTIFALASDGATRDIPVANRNYSLLKFNPDAVKTGFLIEAQRNVAIKKGDTIAVVLHARSMKERDDILRKVLPQE